MTNHYLKQFLPKETLPDTIILSILTLLMLIEYLKCLNLHFSISVLPIVLNLIYSSFIYHKQFLIFNNDTLYALESAFLNKFMTQRLVILTIIQG